MANGDAKETLQKLSELGAYIKVLQKDNEKIDEMRSLVVTLNTEVAQLKKDNEKFWKMYNQYQQKIPLIETKLKYNDSKSERAFKAIKTLKTDYHEFKKGMKEYPEMLDAYKQVKSTVIKILITILLTGIGGGLAVSALYNRFAG